MRSEMEDSEMEDDNPPPMRHNSSHGRETITDQTYVVLYETTV